MEDMMMKREYIPPTIDIIEFNPLMLQTGSDFDVEVYEDEEYPIGDAL